MLMEDRNLVWPCFLGLETFSYHKRVCVHGLPHSWFSPGRGGHSKAPDITPYFKDIAVLWCQGWRGSSQPRRIRAGTELRAPFLSLLASQDSPQSCVEGGPVSWAAQGDP